MFTAIMLIVRLQIPDESVLGHMLAMQELIEKKHDDAWVPEKSSVIYQKYVKQVSPSHL